MNRGKSIERFRRNVPEHAPFAATADDPRGRRRAAATTDDPRGRRRAAATRLRHIMTFGFRSGAAPFRARRPRRRGARRRARAAPSPQSGGVRRCSRARLALPARDPDVAATHLHEMSTSRRRRDSPPRNIHVAASPRLVSTECPRRGRGVAATRVRGISTSRPRRRRDSCPRNIHVAVAASPRLASAEYASRSGRPRISPKF